jgi:2-polyprenyl-3-methyl-5-hydroxy-6-metoxy-1,4-benzoquinol methylase
MDTINKKCLVCGSSELTHFLECTDHFVSGEKFNIYQCNSCGFRFTADAPDAENIGKYYHSENYISHSDTQKGIVNKLYHAVRNIMLKRKCRMIQKSVAGKNILDIGCGTGYFPHYMQQKGFNASGMEIEPGARKFAADNFGLKVSSPDELLNEKLTGQFDVITLWHVLEHLYDLPRYLNWINNSLKNDGALFIALPNCNSYDAKKYGQFWAAYDVPRHLWHFNPTTFEKLISQYGFNLIKIKSLPFDAYYNSMMSAKYAGKRFSFINGIFTGHISNDLSSFDSKKGSSVIYICKKKV